MVCLLLAAGLPHVAPAQAADETNLFRLAQTYEQGGRVEDALRYYSDLLTLQPLNQGYFDGVRRCLTSLKRYPEAVDLVTRRMARFPKDVQLPVWLGSLQLRAGNEAAALQAWNAAVDQNPKNEAVYTMIADEAVNNRQYARAVEFLEKGRRNLINERLFTFEMARAYAMQLNFDGAMGEYLAYLVAVPSAQALVQQQIAQFESLPDALDAAFRLTQRAVQDNPKHPPLRYLLAWLAMERKDYDVAFREYREIDRLGKADGTEVLAFARRAMTEKSWRVAIDAFTHLAATYPDGRYTQEAEFSIARCTESLSDEPGAAPDLRMRAASLYEAVVAKHPKNAVTAEARFRLATMAFQRSDGVGEAVAILRDLAPLRRTVIGNCEADILLGDAILASGSIDDAMKHFVALKSLPKLAPKERNTVNFRIAEILYFQGLFDSAAAALVPLTENTSADIANDALALAAHIGQYQEQPAVLKDYAHAILLERQRNSTEAAAILAGICERNASLPLADRAAIELAGVLHKSGRHSEAAAVLENFLTTRVESILRDEALITLGLLYDAPLNDAARALDCYQRLLVDHPNSIYCGQARERIQVLRKGHS